MCKDHYNNPSLSLTLVDIKGNPRYVRFKIITMYSNTISIYYHQIVRIPFSIQYLAIYVVHPKGMGTNTYVSRETPAVEDIWHRFSLSRSASLRNAASELAYSPSALLPHRTQSEPTITMTQCIFNKKKFRIL